MDREAVLKYIKNLVYHGKSINDAINHAQHQFSDLQPYEAGEIWYQAWWDGLVELPPLMP